MGQVVERATALDRYAAALRQRWILESAYPALPECSALWLFLPNGRPTTLSREGRYVLFAYRAVVDLLEELREWLIARDAALWLAAVEAEARFHWECELATMPESPARWSPPITAFTPSATLAVA